MSGVGPLQNLVAATTQINLYAITDPGPNDDSTAGYMFSSIWRNVLTHCMWFCSDSTPNAAIWVKQPYGLPDAVGFYTPGPFEYIIPSNANSIRAFLIGPGGGGGGGPLNNSILSALTGGGGGQAGGYATAFYPMKALQGLTKITGVIPDGGIGGAGRTTVGQGNPGTAGVDFIINCGNFKAKAPGGAAGDGGKIGTTGALGGLTNYGVYLNIGGSGGPSAANGGLGSPGSSAQNPSAPGGGGGAGGMAVGGQWSPGGAGGNGANEYGAPSGGPGGSAGPGASGGPGTDNPEGTAAGGGGGGGGASGNASYNGGNGGAGGRYGSGGGGGGPSAATRSGDGAKGAGGIIVFQVI